MPESEWSEEMAEPPKKGIPMWVWGCGGCGLIAMILVLVAIGMGVSTFTKMTDPEVVWPKVNEVLPFDERPAGFQAYGGDLFGSGGFAIINTSESLMAIIFDLELESGDDAEMDELFSGGVFKRDNKFGMTNVKDITPIKVTVGGREVKALRFRSSDEFDFPMMEAQKTGGEAWVLLVDLSREEGRLRMIEIIDMKPHESGDEEESLETAQKIGQELSDRFFDHFKPWD